MHGFYREYHEVRINIADQFKFGLEREWIIIMEKKYPVLNRMHQLHYYANGATLYHKFKINYCAIELPGIGADIIELCNGMNTVDEIFEILAIRYNINLCDQTQKKAMNDFISKAIDSNILYIKTKCGEKKINISGIKNAKYPYMIMFEVTDKCNFACGHCYKEAKNNKANFIEKEIVYDIIDKVRYKTPLLAISGGEPTLYPYLNQIIRYAGKDFKIFLYTNGSNLGVLEEKTYQLLNSVTVSMYGNSEEMYKKVTGTYGFNKFCFGIEKLQKQNISTMVTITINKLNIENLDSYIQILAEKGVRNIFFGLAIPAGRFMNRSSDIWQMEENEVEKAVKITEQLKIKYKSINIYPLSGNGTIFGCDDGRTTDRGEKFRCLAGNKLLVITEEAKVKPCVMLPEEIYSKCGYKEYFDHIDDTDTHMFHKNAKVFESYLLKRGFRLEDMKCKGFYS